MSRRALLHPGFIYLRRTNLRARDSVQGIKVLLAHGHTLFREAVKHLLEREGVIQVVALAADGVEAADHCRLLTPDVLVMDISLPPIGVKGLPVLLNHLPSRRILLLALSPNTEEVREAVGQGVPGVLGNCDSTELARAIYALYRGQSFFSSQVASLIAGEKPPPHS